MGCTVKCPRCDQEVEVQYGGELMDHNNQLWEPCVPKEEVTPQKEELAAIKRRALKGKYLGGA